MSKFLIECTNCLKPMKGKEGKKFCCDNCRYEWHTNPKSAGKLRKQIFKLIDERLRDLGIIPK